MIFALSPQAKGMVERTTGIFQDRLLTELRLAGATSIEEANVALDDFVDRFGVPAQEPEVAFCPLDTRMCWTQSYASSAVAGSPGTTP